MPRLVNLEGKADPIEFESYSYSVDELIRDVQQHGAATCAGHDGAINVWRDDKGALRANLCSYGFEREKHMSKTIPELQEWLNTWFEEIGLR